MRNNAPIIGHGFVLGKFMPLHEGHRHLLYFASQSCHKLTIMVCSTPNDPIPGPIRYAWVKHDFPLANVIHHYADVPHEPKDHPDFWPIWMKSIADHCPGEKFDAVFGSEDYGFELAARLNADYIPVDRLRNRVPISGTQIRNDPVANWQYIPVVARPYFVKRVAILGPMSTGKSTLSKQLAEYFNTVCVDEYARSFMEDIVRQGRQRDADFFYEDMIPIARQQRVLEQVMAYRSNVLLFCDTDALTTYAYSTYFFGKAERWIEEAALSDDYWMTYVLDPNDVPYDQDGTRVMAMQASRVTFFEHIIKCLDRTKRRYEIVKMTTNFIDRRWDVNNNIVKLLKPSSTPDLRIAS